MIPKKLLDELNLWIDEKKFGNIQINFSNGVIVSVKRSDSVRVNCLGNLIGSTAELSTSGTTSI